MVRLISLIIASPAADFNEYRLRNASQLILGSRFQLLDIWLWF